MPLVIDQATSATAYVNLRKAAEHGEPIPEGWPSMPPASPPPTRAALDGLLLAFGGKRGANIALMVEVLAAGHDRRELVIGLSTVRPRQRLAGGGTVHCRDGAALWAPDFSARLAAQLERLSSLAYAGQTAGIPRN